MATRGSGTETATGTKAERLAAARAEWLVGLRAWTKANRKWVEAEREQDEADAVCAEVARRISAIEQEPSP